VGEEREGVSDTEDLCHFWKDVYGIFES